MDKTKLGIVYVLSNPAMPGIVKIGRSDQKDLKQRLRSLFNTSVPLPFKVEYACYVEKSDTKDLEAALHSAFADKRVHEKREFFRVQIDQVIPILQFCNKGEATKDISHQLSTLDANAEAESSFITEDTVKTDAPIENSEIELSNQSLCNSRFYSYNGKGKFSKGEIARKVVHLYQHQNPMAQSSDLMSFYGVGKINDIELIPQKRKDERRFATEDEIKTHDGVTMLITTQWSYKNFSVVLDKAKELGAVIKPIESGNEILMVPTTKAELGEKTRGAEWIATKHDIRNFQTAINVHMTCKGVRVDAKYNPNTMSILLLKGSHISLGVVEKYRSKRSRQIQNYLVDGDETNVLKCDVVFKTVSGAAVFISGNDINGWDAWKTNAEQSLNDAYRKK